MGKEFDSVGDGKVLGFFEYLHPTLSVGNGNIDFRRAYPHYDIWSLGVILYRLIYKRSPFYKEGKLEFSKTILRKYLAGEYEVRYLSNKFASINRFIARCLKVAQKEVLAEKEEEFKSWVQVMDWVVR
jgi:serine/threonine protein kinase